VTCNRDISYSIRSELFHMGIHSYPSNLKIVINIQNLKILYFIVYHIYLIIAMDKQQFQQIIIQIVKFFVGFLQKKIS